MSDQRPEWMPSNEEMFHSSGRSDSTGYTSCERDAIERAHFVTGLRAQIAALEEEDAHMVLFHGGHYNDENREHRNFMLATLRKELGE